MPAYLSTSRIYYIAMYWHGDVPVGGQVGRSAGRQVGRSAPIKVYGYAYKYISIFRSVLLVPTCRPAGTLGGGGARRQFGTNMGLHIHYKVMWCGVGVFVGRVPNTVLEPTHGP